MHLNAAQSRPPCPSKTPNKRCVVSTKKRSSLLAFEESVDEYATKSSAPTCTQPVLTPAAGVAGAGPCGHHTIPGGRQMCICAARLDMESWAAIRWRRPHLVVGLFEGVVVFMFLLLV